MGSGATSIPVAILRPVKSFIAPVVAVLVLAGCGGPITDDELQRVVTPLTQYVLRASTGNQFWMQQLGGASFDPRRITAARSIIHDLKSVTAADLQATAAKYLRPEKDWTMEVVPARTKTGS